MSTDDAGAIGRAAAGRRAFTLIEMLVVMGIIALVVGLGVAVYFGTAEYNRLNAAIRGLESGISAARSAAILERKSVRFRYNAERHCFYWIAEEEAPNLLGAYGDAGTDVLTGSRADFLRGNVVREPLLGGNGIQDTTTLQNDDTWFDGSTTAIPPVISPIVAGQIFVCPGDDGILDTMPAPAPAGDDEAAYVYVEDRFAEAPQYISDSVTVVRQNLGTGVWQQLDFDVIFDRNGRASFPPGFEVNMRVIRVALISGELAEYQLVIVPTTGEVIRYEQ